MKTAVMSAFLGLMAMLLAACGTPQMSTAPSTGTVITKPAATVEALVALEKQANAAYLKSESNFFAARLNENFRCAQTAARWTKPRL